MASAGRHECPCGKAFPTAFKLQRHSLVHTGEKAFACTECGQCFAQVASLKLHVRHKHLAWRPHQCEDCGKSFVRAEHLRAHYKTHGREAKPPVERKKVAAASTSSPPKTEVLTCVFCEGGKVFAHAWKLERHLLIHTGERPFPCSLCGAAFNQNSSLKSHMRTHTGEKPFACKDCGRAFTRADHLRYHARTHTSERPFGCGECSRRFGSSSGLARHRSEHKTRSRQLQCIVCRASFARAGNLRDHLKRVHDQLASFRDPKTEPEAAGTETGALDEMPERKATRDGRGKEGTETGVVTSNAGAPSVVAFLERVDGGDSSENAGVRDVWNWQAHPGERLREMMEDDTNRAETREKQTEETETTIHNIGVFHSLRVKHEAEDIVGSEHSNINSSVNHDTHWNKPDYFSVVSQEPILQDQKPCIKGKFENLNFIS